MQTEERKNQLNVFEELSSIGKGRLLILIPAYNESENIERVIGNLVMNYPEYDYILINDGSSDATRKICSRNRYNMLDLPVNIGLGEAIKAGMRYANFYGYDYALQLDGDGQHDPKYIGSMVQCMKETGCDIVIGSRFVRRKRPKTARMIGSRVIQLAIQITTGGKKIADTTSGMRLFSKKMIKQFAYNIHYSPEPDTLAYLLNHGVRIEEVQVEMHERIAGKSYLNFKNSVWYMLKMLFSIFIFQWVRKKPDKPKGEEVI